MSAISTLSLALRKLGPIGTVRLLAEKRAKKQRLNPSLIADAYSVRLRSVAKRPALTLSDEASRSAIEHADAMVRDENFFFSFPYRLRGVSDPWNYDPLQKAYWPRRTYEETRVHSADTPKDVKLVWEINRFKDLPTLGIAAYITHNERYASEAYDRMSSWIDGNPFMQSVNWSSPLEIAIRLISWTATIRLLTDAGFPLANERIARSIWEQLTFLAADLSTDKIVRSNHLIGEAAGMVVVSSLFDFPGSEEVAARGVRVLTDAVLEQTYEDGASRETSGWYHGFVTDFVELCERTAATVGAALPQRLVDRARLMKRYRNSVVATDGGIVKFGDFDNGKATDLAGDWRDVVFGADPNPATDRLNVFPTAQHITATLGRDYLFLRSGEFGWGGDGFSSHAHDDLLAPVVYLDGLPILVDPGTYVYVGYPKERDALRVAEAHNRIIFGSGTGAVLKQWFGWMKTSSPARIDRIDDTDTGFSVEASYDQYRNVHSRFCRIGAGKFAMEDRFVADVNETVEWNLHFHPRWRLEPDGSHRYILSDYRNNRYRIELSAGNAELELLAYEFSPSYMTKTQAQKLRLRSSGQSSGSIVTIELTRSSQ